MRLRSIVWTAAFVVAPCTAPFASAAPKTSKGGVTLAVTPHAVVSKNLAAAATVYRAAALEEARVFEVVDAIASQFISGKLPLDKGSAAKIHAYVNARNGGLDAPSRARLYGHVLGVEASGKTETSAKVQVNRDFAPLLARFVDAATEFQRPGSTRAAKSVDARVVRQRARDLALNLSNRAYGAPVQVAEQLERLVERAGAIVEDKAVQRAFGAKGADDLVELVARDALHVTVDAASQRARALAGAQLIGSLRGIASSSASKGGKAAEDTASATARVAESVRTLDRATTAKHKPRGISKRRGKVLALCLDDDGALVGCKTKAAKEP